MIMLRIAPRALLLAVTLFVMVGLKQHYSQAAVDELSWILAPTAKVVSLVTGSHFEFEPGAGYLSREHFFLIEKPCAGVNFMIAAIAMLVLLFSGKATSLATGAQVFAMSLVLSYVAAVLVNAARILIALWLRAHAIESVWWTTARVHRGEGIVVYFAGLVVLHAFARRLTLPRQILATRSFHLSSHEPRKVPTERAEPPIGEGAEARPGDHFHSDAQIRLRRPPTGTSQRRNLGGRPSAIADHDLSSPTSDTVKPRGVARAEGSA